MARAACAALVDTACAAHAHAAPLPQQLLLPPLPSACLTSSPMLRKPWPQPSYTNSVALPPAALILSAYALADWRAAVREGAEGSARRWLNKAQQRASTLQQQRRRKAA